MSTASYAHEREGDPSDLLWEEEEHLGEDPKVVVTPVHVDFTLDNLGALSAADVSFCQTSAVQLHSAPTGRGRAAR